MEKIKYWINEFKWIILFIVLIMVPAILVPVLTGDMILDYIFEKLFGDAGDGILQFILLIAAIIGTFFVGRMTIKAFRKLK